MPAPGMTKAKNPVTRIYLSAGTNAYSDSELRTDDNSSGENQNTSGPGENTPPPNSGNTSGNGSGITVIDPFDNTQIISLPAHQVNPGNGGNSGGSGISVIDPAAPSNGSAGKAFEFVADIKTIENVTISGVTPDEDDADISVLFLYDEIDTTETVLSADEIETREYEGEDEYINPNYGGIQIGELGDVFVDNNGESYSLTESGFTALNNNPGTIIDYPLNSIIIKKEDATNGNLLEGAVFELYRMSDETSGQSGTLVARLVTGSSGMLAVIGLEAGVYLVKEVQPPPNYTLNNQGTQTAFFVPDNTSNIEFTFSNYPFGAILVDKVDALTNKPLAGARFELKRADGSHVSYGTTDNYGHVTFGFLEPGAYIISEQEAPNGYQIDTSPQTVHVPANGQMQTVYFKNQPFGSLMIIKKDAHTNTPIQGAKFKVTDIHGANIGDITPGNGFSADGIYTTDNNGEIRIDHIPEGHYLLTEVYVPDGYLIDTTPKVVYAEWGKIKTCEFWNSRKGGLVISKYDAVTKMPLADAVFKVTDSRGAVIGENGGLFRTDETGHIYLYDLTPGSYRVYEEEAPLGYILDNNVQTIDILDEKIYYLEFFNQPVNSFTIMKYDADTRKPLQGAVIRVQQLGSTTKHIGDFETNEDGMIIINDLLPGAYSIQEITAPQNYVLDSTVKNISLEQGKPQVVTLYNSRYGDLLVTKINSKTKTPIEGVKFKLTKQNGEFIGEYLTDSDGYITVNNLVPGFYILQELECPPEYVRDITPKTVEIISNKLQTIQFVNKPKSRVRIRKLDADTGVGVAGAVFSVETGSALVGTFTSGADGEVEVGLLDPGNYVFTEITPPPNYTLNGGTNDIQRFSVTDTDDVTMTFQNHSYGNMVIIKRDEFDNRPLAGAEFTVSYASGAFYGNYTTMIDGTILIPNIEPGIYIIRETRSPNGYMLDNAAKTVTVPAVVTTEVVFTNRPKSGIHINKIDSETRKALSGAEFKLTRPNGEVIGTKVTDVGGSVIFDNLEAGSYIITETRSPQGYVLNSTAQTVVVTADKITTIDFENKPLSDIKIVKTDAVSKKPLSGAVFKITKPDGTLIGTYTTNVSGLIQIGGLVPGTYVVSETAAPDGYVRDNIPKTVEVKSGSIAEIEVENNPLSGIKIIAKNSVNNNPLANVKFKVSKLSGELVGNYITSVAGDVIVPDLEPGSYNIQQIEAPLNYVLDNASQTVEVKSGKLTEAEFLNDPYGSIDIVISDSVTEAPLKGAVFKVVRALDNHEVGIFTTTASGNVIVPNLAPGVYVISETKSPENYVLEQTSKTITVIKGTAVKAKFENRPYSGIQIIKKNSETGETVSGAEFKMTKSNGETVGNYTTDSTGTVIVESLAPGHYTLTETKAPQFYVLDSTPKTAEVKSDKLASVEFMNIPYGNLVITKTDAQTGVGLKGAVFEVKRVSGEMIGRFTTGEDGVVIVQNLVPGAYLVTEVVAPSGYELDSPPQTVQVGAGSGTGSTSSVTGYPAGSTSAAFVSNNPYGTLEVVKLDKVDKSKALEGAAFELRSADGTYVTTKVTDVNGKIFFGQLKSGNYVLTETVAPDGYEIDTASKNVTVKAGNPESITFYNNPYSGIEILKTDAVTNKALSGATFEVVKANGEKVGQYKTDRTGKIIVSDLEEGIYIISETIAPNGYERDELPKTVTVTSGKIISVKFTNRPHSGIEIIKIDYFSKVSLSGAIFKVEKSNGEKIGEFTTDNTGKIIVPNLAEDVYIISEITAPQGYTISEQPKTITVKSGKLESVTFADKPLAGIEILKIDKLTNLPLSGATFEIKKSNGETAGTFKTDKTGKIIVPDLADGTYIVAETIAPDGYQIDEVPKTIEVKSGKLTPVEFFNKPYAALKIVKLNSITREPIAGVEFNISKMNGEKITNEFGSLTFKTDISGAVYVPNLTDGYYVVTETKAAENYFTDSEPKTILVESNKTTVLEVLNTPMSGLLIVKTDEVTGKPLAGAVYDIKLSDGQFVTGDILDGNQPGTPNNSPSKSMSENGGITGSFTTDENGRIQINGLAAGEYMVIERTAPDGYEADKTVHGVTVISGKMATLQLTNKPKSGLRLMKIDSITKQPLYNVEFMLFDKNNKLVDVYYTDNMGVIDFTDDVSAGRYTIRETRAAQGYYLDEIPKTIEFIAGKITQITWENTPQLGQIQILKKSADDNEINGFPAGTPLEGAIFEIYNYRTGALVDRIISGKDGRAVSNPLPLGRYIIKEVQSPKYYILSDKTLDIELEFATQIVRQEFLNYSANTGVTIKKTGNIEAMPNNEIRYDIKEMRNTSSVPLTDFFWRDVLPTNAVRLTKIVTGTYNQSLKYKVTATTNKGDTRVIADNLSTTKNNVIDCSNAALGLKSDEFITTFSLIFGTVKAGFTLVEIPQIYVKVLPNLQNGFEFANKCDVGGKHSGEFVIGNSVWNVKIYNPNQKLPRTGY